MTFNLIILFINYYKYIIMMKFMTLMDCYILLNLRQIKIYKLIYQTTSIIIKLFNKDKLGLWVYMIEARNKLEKQQLNKKIKILYNRLY